MKTLVRVPGISWRHWDSYIIRNIFVITPRDEDYSHEKFHSINASLRVWNY